MQPEKSAIKRTSVIRLATVADIDVLLPLVKAYRVFYGQQPDPDVERAFIEAHLRTGTSIIYLAEPGSVAAGFTQLFKTYSTVHLANVWILEDLYVAPEYRGRGIASDLLASALEHARADGASGMFLETAVDNRAAQRVYKRAGWMREEHFLKYNAPLG